VVLEEPLPRYRLEYQAELGVLFDGGMHVDLAQSAKAVFELCYRLLIKDWVANLRVRCV
jgi:hypothetical protein